MWLATHGTAVAPREAGLAVVTVWRISEGRQPDALGLICQERIDLIINLSAGHEASRDAA